MKKILTTLAAVLLFTLTIRATDLITFHLAVTNTPADGDTITINGTTRTWKTTVANAATQIQTTNVLGQAATNLFQQLGTYPISGVITLTVTNTNVTALGLSLSASVTSGWATNFFTTNTVGTSKMVNTPFTVYTGAEATNIASDLVTALDQYNTNNFSATNVALANFVNRSTTQTIGGVKTFTNLNGTVGNLTNGTLTNPTLTNGTNMGLAFSSPGPGAGSEQFGSGSVASNTLSVAIGNAAISMGAVGTAVGSSALASNTYSVAVGNTALSQGTASTAIGTGASAIGSSSVAIGTSANASFSQSIAIGAGALSTAANQIALGTSGDTTMIPGDISILGQVTTILTAGAGATLNGTNRFNGNLNLTQRSNGGLANGGNAAVDPSTNVYMKVSGPSGAFSINGILGGANGRVLIIQNSTGQTMTIANDSGIDPVAANRIYTGFGADIAQTNNPGFVTLIYDAAVSRWCLVSTNR